MSPTTLSNNAVEQNPIFRIVIAARSFLSQTITLIGSSSIRGIHTIRNCPGLALELILSLKTKVLTVGVSSITCSIITVLSLSIFVGKSNNLHCIFQSFSFNIFSDTSDNIAKCGQSCMSNNGAQLYC